mgnify:CR=1 FL=1
MVVKSWIKLIRQIRQALGLEWMGRAFGKEVIMVDLAVVVIIKGVVGGVVGAVMAGVVAVVEVVVAEEAVVVEEVAVDPAEDPVAKVTDHLTIKLTVHTEVHFTVADHMPSFMFTTYLQLVTTKLVVICHHYMVSDTTMVMDGTFITTWEITTLVLQMLQFHRLHSIMLSSSAFAFSSSLFAL